MTEQHSSLAESIGIVHFGLGEIGVALVRGVERAPALASVAAVDVRQELVGLTLSQIGAGGGDVIVRADLDEALEGGRDASVAFHAAGSHLVTIEPQIGRLLDAGLHVVTTAEELIRPDGRAAECAAKLDERAKASGVTLFPAGVNPGFLMDRLPAYVTSMTVAPTWVHVRRVVDLGRRRQALRRKMAVGEPVAAVNERIAARTIGHVGLVESLGYLADALGWRLGPVEESLAPLVAESRVERAGETVEAGRVLGLEHRATGRDSSGRGITLELTMRIDAEASIDEIEVEADPPLRLAMPEGLNGDTATVASVLNAARFVTHAPAGLQRVLQVPFANVYGVG